jgi:hypothetical protein
MAYRSKLQNTHRCFWHSAKPTSVALSACSKVQPTPVARKESVLLANQFLQGYQR